jgi:hypothetical protein
MLLNNANRVEDTILGDVRLLPTCPAALAALVADTAELSVVTGARTLGPGVGESHCRRAFGCVPSRWEAGTSQKAKKIVDAYPTLLSISYPYLSNL